MRHILSQVFTFADGKLTQKCWRAERHFGVSKEEFSAFNIAEELESRVQALHLDEVLIPLEEEKEGDERDEKEKKSSSLTIINQLQFIDTCATRTKKLVGASRSLFFKFDSSDFWSFSWLIGNRLWLLKELRITYLTHFCSNQYY